MVDVYAELLALVKALEAAQIEYALCGAHALAVHGAPRATKDIGFVFDALPWCSRARRSRSSGSRSWSTAGR